MTESEEKIAQAVQSFIKQHIGGNTSVFRSSDKWTVYAGERWFERIMAELEQAKVVVSLLSSESVVRPWVNFEAGAAWREHPLIPACFGGLTKGALPKPYSSIQAVDLSDPHDQYYLITSICHYLGTTLTPPPLGAGDVYRQIHDALKEYDKARKST